MLTSVDEILGSQKQDRRVLSRLIDRGVVIATVLAGLLLPVISLFAVPSGLINVPWGSYYGLGFALLRLIIGPFKGGLLGLSYGIVGFIVWPSLLALGLSWALEGYAIKIIQELA